MPTPPRSLSLARSLEGGEGLFKGLADQIRQLEHAVTRQEERFSAVMEIGRAIGSTLDLDELLHLVMNKVTQLLGAERSTLFLVDAETGELWSKIAQSAKEIRLPAGRGIAGWVAKHGEPVNLADVYQDDRFNPEIDRLTGFLTRCVLAVPLRGRTGQVIGVTQALNRKDGIFTADDQLLLEALAAQAAVAIENAQMYQAMKRQNVQLARTQGELNALVAELDVLYDIERRISAAPTLEQLLDGILARAMQLTDSDAGSLVMVSEDGGELFFKAALGEKGEEVKRLTLGAGEGIVGFVAHAGKPLIANDLPREKTYDPRVAKKVGYRARSVLCVPLSLEGRVVGALELLNKGGEGGYTEADLRVATLVAGQAARAITLGKSREEEERKKRLAVIGQMISGVVHDLRTPMTIISGYAQIMAGEDDRAEREKASEVILKQFDTINGMIKETLAFAKGERELLLRKVYLNRFLDEVSEYLERDFAAHAVELKVQAGFKGAVRVDENKLKRLVYNIARNAVEAMPEGGRFTLSTELDEAEGMVVFKFSDTGQGIPAEVGDRLFESFVTHGKPNGTGLGLAMCKKIAVEHGGDISFKSKPGKGTTFVLRIPA
jgi:signal transduction histidine kinase